MGTDDPFVRTVIEAGEKLGYKAVIIPPEEMDRLKEESRKEDAQAIASGRMTPEEVQAKNSAIPEGVEFDILDFSPSFQ
ncbi:MAG: hypothetical protein AAGA64_07380 [Bacteroidota bacterium]